MHGVVIHMCPRHGFKFEHAPHRLVGKANLASNGFVSTRFPELFEQPFNRVSHVEIKTRAPRRRYLYHPPGVACGLHFTS